MTAVVLQAGSGILETVGQLAAIAGALVLVLILLGLGSFAYKSLRGDGIEWPDEQESDEDDSVERSEDDDEWKYY